MRSALLIFLILIASKLGAVNFPFPSGASSAGLGNMTTVVNDGYAVMNNPSILAYYKLNTVYFSYTNRYFLPGVGVSQIGASFNKGGGAWFGSVQQFGFKQFNEYNLGFGYARKFGDHFSAGLTFSGLMVVAPYQEKRLHQGTVQLSTYYEIGNGIHFGATVFNPTAAKYKMEYYTDQIPVVFRAGVSTIQIENLFLAAEIELSNVHAGMLRLGVGYNFYKTCFVRTGIASNPGLISVGMGCEINTIKVEMAVQNTDRLGKSVIVSLSYQL